MTRNHHFGKDYFGGMTTKVFDIKFCAKLNSN